MKIFEPEIKIFAEPFFVVAFNKNAWRVKMYINFLRWFLSILCRVFCWKGQLFNYKELNFPCYIFSTFPRNFLLKMKFNPLTTMLNPRTNWHFKSHIRNARNFNNKWYVKIHPISMQIHNIISLNFRLQFYQNIHPKYEQRRFLYLYFMYIFFWNVFVLLFFSLFIIVRSSSFI